jgi:hypothetical protein
MGKPYTTLENVKKLMAGDVSRVEKYARFLFIVDEDGCPRALYARSDAPLNIIAVLGPAVYNGHAFDTTLLLEIGLGRARPYHAAFAPQGVLPKGRAILKRRNYKLLGVERFKALWPYICDVLVEHAESIVGGWKHRTWNIPSSRSRVRGGQVVTHTKEVEHILGVRISVSFEDGWLVQAMCALDIQRSSEAIRKQASLLCYCLNGYKNADYSGAKLRQYARARQGRMRLLVESFGPKEGREYGRLRPHHVAYMYARGWIPLKNRALFECCAEFFHLVDSERVPSFSFVRYGYSGEDPGFDVWIIPTRRKEADYLVCEIIPRVQGGLA